MNLSLIQRAIDKRGMRAFTEAFTSQLASKYPNMTDQESASYLQYFWPAYARPQQKTPKGNWHIWFVLAGRGYGKTRTGAEWVREQVEDFGKKRIA
ncbi:hypothetical protein LCGC14_2553780, partial [marine sediment metagenome]